MLGRGFPLTYFRLQVSWAVSLNKNPDLANVSAECTHGGGLCGPTFGCKLTPRGFSACPRQREPSSSEGAVLPEGTGRQGEPP